MSLLDKTGMHREELDEIRSNLNTDMQSNASQEVDTTDSALLGEFLGIVASDDHRIEEAIQAVKKGNNLLTSEGDDLDRQGADWGIWRRAATSAVVQLQIDGIPTATIPAETQFSTEDGILFQTTEDAVINSTTTVKDDDGKDVPLEDDDGNAMGRILVNAEAIDTGLDTNVGADQITVIAEPIDNVVAVTNPQAASGGADDEGDTEYKLRIYWYRLNRPDSSENGVKTYLENYVDGVIQAKVVPNRTMQTDKYGNPQKTTHVYVIGGSDQDVANGIFAAVATPADTVGKITQTVYNDSGDPRQVSFDRAETVPIYVHVELTTDDTFDTDNGVNDLKNSVKTYVDTLLMGNPVLYFKLFTYLGQIKGVTNATIEMGTDKTKLTQADVKVGEFQLATVDLKDIEVVVK